MVGLPMETYLGSFELSAKRSRCGLGGLMDLQIHEGSLGAQLALTDR